MSVSLHVLNAGGKLSHVEPRLRSCFPQALRRIRERLPVGGVDVLVCSEPGSTVPELGIGGYAPCGDRCYVFLDPEHTRLHENLETAFLRSLAHELHHCVRWRGPGYGRRLSEALITEGLACHFESEVLSGPLPCYASQLSRLEFGRIRALAAAEATKPEYDHRRWFYGTAELPRYAGYALGAELVGTYIARTGTSASSMVNASLSECQP